MTGKDYIANTHEDKTSSCKMSIWWSLFLTFILQSSELYKLSFINFKVESEQKRVNLLSKEYFSKNFLTSFVKIKDRFFVDNYINNL